MLRVCPIYVNVSSVGQNCFFSPLRKRMKASTLETLLFLNANQNLWPDASIIQKIIDTPNDDDEEPTEGGSDDDEEF